MVYSVFCFFSALVRSSISTEDEGFPSFECAANAKNTAAAATTTMKETPATVAQEAIALRVTESLTEIS